MLFPGPDLPADPRTGSAARAAGGSRGCGGGRPRGAPAPPRPHAAESRQPPPRLRIRHLVAMPVQTVFVPSLGSDQLNVDISSSTA